MAIILILGIVIFLIGILLLVAPEWLSKTSEYLNRKVFDDRAVLGHRVLLALVSLALGALLLWMYFGHHVLSLMK